jgi:hypothetical protein
VRGVVMVVADGTRWMCDKDVAGSATDCASGGLEVVGDPVSGSIQLFGVKSGTTLTVNLGPPTDNTLVPASVLAVTPST